MKIILVFLVLFGMAGSALAATSSSTNLEDQLKTLEMPGNQAPAATREKIYVLQQRYLPLRFKSEASAGLATNLTGDSFLVTKQAELGYRFHFSDRWSLGVGYSFVSNQFSDSANRIINQEGIIPDVSYAQSRADLTVGYNVFYGKFRLSMDQVFYFDQYLALGPGVTQLNTGPQSTAVGDVGFVFWLGQWGSARLGLKDYFYKEPRRSESIPSHNLHAHLDVGYLF